jgi:hypothetical protein
VRLYEPNDDDLAIDCNKLTLNASQLALPNLGGSEGDVLALDAYGLWNPVAPGGGGGTPGGSSGDVQINNAGAFGGVSPGTAGNVLKSVGGAWASAAETPWNGAIADINLDGGTDIGAALADADLILVDDGGAGTNRKCAMSRVKTYTAWGGAIADINLDGGTDIGAALADADLILVDDGGAGTNRKCAVSRIKTYLAAWVDTVLTRQVEILVSDPNGSAITTGDGKAYVTIPAVLNGWNLTAAHAGLTTVSSSGLPTIQIRNVTDSQDMLSTRITIDANEKTSYTAATAPVIDAAKDDVATGDLLAIDIDGAGTGAKGLMVMLQFGKP